jgi:hypothetical protein
VLARRATSLGTKCPGFSAGAGAVVDARFDTTATAAIVARAIAARAALIRRVML